MKIKYIIYLIITYSFCLESFAKIPELSVVIPEKALKIDINYSDEVIILQKGIVKKYDIKGNLLASYGNIYINKQTDIISFNTFRTILYCGDFGKIIILDKRFGEVGIIDVYSISGYLVSRVGISYDNSNLWLWDDIRQVLLKTDQKGNIGYVSSNINIYTDIAIHPSIIAEFATRLYLNDSTKGIFVFDNTGTYQKIIPIPQIQSFYEKEGLLFYISDNIIYSYNFLSFEQKEYTRTPILSLLKIGQSILCGINSEGFVEVWNY